MNTKNRPNKKTIRRYEYEYKCRTSIITIKINSCKIYVRTRRHVVKGRRRQLSLRFVLFLRMVNPRLNVIFDFSGHRCAGKVKHQSKARGSISKDGTKKREKKRKINKMHAKHMQCEYLRRGRTSCCEYFVPLRSYLAAFRVHRLFLLYKPHIMVYINIMNILIMRIEWLFMCLRVAEELNEE